VPEYFVEEHGPAMVGIHRRELTPEQAAEIAGTGVYVELVACECSGFEHFFGKDFDLDAGYGCPGPLDYANDCCGAPSDLDVVRVCAHGCCQSFYCGRCGTDTLAGVGPAGCRCDDRMPRTYAPAMRRMIPTPNGREYTRRQRARRRTR
jgi:hypothetical protein